VGRVDAEEGFQSPFTIHDTCLSLSLTLARPLDYKNHCLRTPNRELSIKDIPSYDRRPNGQ